MNVTTAGRVGSALAGAMAVVELVRVLVMRQDLTGWGDVVSILGAALFIGFLAVSAVGLALRRRFGWAFGVFGALLAIAYGVMITAGGTGHTHAMWGTIYLFGGMGLFACLARSLSVYRRPFVHT